MPGEAEKEGVAESPQQKRPTQRKDGPEFIPKLKDKRIEILLHSGRCYRGTLLRYNRFELLFQEERGPPPIIIMKNFIAVILPLDGNPFEKKPEEENKMPVEPKGPE